VDLSDAEVSGGAGQSLPADVDGAASFYGLCDGDARAIGKQVPQDVRCDLALGSGVDHAWRG
jgi:hypothetical protein